MSPARPDDKVASPSEARHRSQLPEELQTIADTENDFLDSVYEGQAPDSTETNYRYAAYAIRARTILMSAQRYIAYTSDIGESFRPVAHPWLIRSAYGISWAYLIGDVSNEGYKAYCRNQALLPPRSDPLRQTTGSDRKSTSENSSNMSEYPHIPAIDGYKAVMAKRAVFQGVASMGLPAFTIHSIVRYSGRAMKDLKNQKLRTYGPIGLGLGVVPLLPWLFDKPVEGATDWLFYTAYRAIGGEKAVGDQKPGHSPIGPPGSLKHKDKEL